jgi:hypothetical protein
MLFEYKIQKVADGNGDVRYDIYTSNVFFQRWYKKKVWRKATSYDSYLAETLYTTLGDAQEAVHGCMKRDKKQEYNNNKSVTKVLKEYMYTKIPEYIPEEQQEKFCELGGAKNAV